MSQMRNEYKLKWATEHRESRQKSIKKWLEAHPERRKDALRNYYLRIKERDAHKLAARIAVREAVRKGVLVRPEICSRCGKPCIPHGHHHKGYEKKNWIEVIWLCLACHIEEHKCE